MFCVTVFLSSMEVNGLICPMSNDTHVENDIQNVSDQNVQMVSDREKKKTINMKRKFGSRHRMQLYVFSRIWPNPKSSWPLILYQWTWLWLVNEFLDFVKQKKFVLVCTMVESDWRLKRCKEHNNNYPFGLKVEMAVDHHDRKCSPSPKWIQLIARCSTVCEWKLSDKPWL